MDNIWYLRTQDETFGPESKEKLIEWAEMGRIQPGQEVSDDNLIWRPVEEVPFLDMRFSIDIGDGNPRGPFNRRAAEALLASGRLPPVSKMVEVRDPFPADADVPTVDADIPTVDADIPTVDAESLPRQNEEENVLIERGEAAASPTVDAESLPRQTVDAESLPRQTVDAESLPRQNEEENVLIGRDEDIASTGRDEDIASTGRGEAAASTERGEDTASTGRGETAASPVKIVEKIVEVPVEKIIEVPVEKIVEKIVEKRVVDETRVKELEGLLEEERRHTADLQNRMDAASKEAAARFVQAQEEAEARLAAEQKESSEQLAAAQQKAEAAAKESAARLEQIQKESAERLAEVQQKAEAAQKDADVREQKSREQIVALENELRRLPQAASEVADIQAAVYAIMTKEAAEIAELLEVEKREADDFRSRQQARADRLLERRRELLKRAGANIEDMTRKALVERPEDPRMTQLRREYEEFRRADEKKSRDYEDKLLAQAREIEELRREISRRNVADKDAAQLQAEVVALQEKLQRCEKDLLGERQRSEELRQRQAASQQALMARLATLESPTIAPANTLHVPETRQSREARAVKLPRWMQLGGKR